MNFWRASILPLVCAAAAFLGLYAASERDQRMSRMDGKQEAAASTEFRCPNAVTALAAADDSLNGGNEENDGLFRKRSRKCWRPERDLAIALVPIKSPAEGSCPDCAGCDYHYSEPVSSDLLFIAGGYVRLFQKG